MLQFTVVFYLRRYINFGSALLLFCDFIQWFLRCYIFYLKDKTIMVLTIFSVLCQIYEDLKFYIPEDTTQLI